MKVTRLVPLLILGCLATPALAEDTETICTDRPTKGNSACTVPEGMIQVEAEPVFYSRDEQSTSTVWGGFGVKYGVTNSTDVQLFISPNVEVKDRLTGQRTDGFGDVVVRVKQRLSDVSAPVQFAVLPYIKVPTAASGIGNDKVEGGVIVPINFSLGNVGINIVPTLDILADADQQGHHAQFTGTVAVSLPLTDKLSIAGELWTSQNWEPAGTIEQYSADTVIVYLVTPDIQLDAGANFGLNNQTPDVQVYSGISFRF